MRAVNLILNRALRVLCARRRLLSSDDPWNQTITDLLTVGAIFGVETQNILFLHDAPHHEGKRGEDHNKTARLRIYECQAQGEHEPANVDEMAHQAEGSRRNDAPISRQQAEAAPEVHACKLRENDTDHFERRAGLIEQAN